MSCNDCGQQCQGKYCSICEQARLNEKMYGTAEDDLGKWSDKEGQTKITDGDDE